MNKIPCILLVDDDPVTNYVNKTLLLRMGATDTVLTANCGQEALQCLQRGEEAPCPDLILLDVNMPVMGGFEFLDAYRKLPLPRKDSISVVMLTTSSHPHDTKRAAEWPVKGILTKPLTKEKVEGLLLCEELG